MSPTHELPVQLAGKIEPVTESGCWVWMAYCNKAGYGRVYVNGKVRNAHRAVYVVLRGPIPSGIELDHLCRVRCCVNPAHLDMVSHRENVLRGAGVMARQARQTHCKFGHPLYGENLFTTREGKRRCKKCRKGIA